MSGETAKLTKSQILGLFAMGFGTLVIGMDFVALSVALPVIEKDFATDVTTVQWIVTGYALVFGIFLVTGGRLADMFGRRRIFFIGMTIFGLFSLIGGLASDLWIILAARALMGIGGAMMWPAILGMTFSLVPEERAALAGSMIMGVAGFSNALGPLIGGFATEFLSWRWVFFVNVPVVICSVLIAALFVADDAPENPSERVDYPGIVTLSLGLFGLLLLLDIGAGLGWFDPIIIGLFFLSIIFLALFMFIEGRSGENALVPEDVRSNGGFLAVIITTLLMSSIYFAPIMYLPQFLSKLLGYSAFYAGLGIVPLLGIFAAVSLVAGPLYDRLGAKLVIAIGAILLGLGIFLLSRAVSAQTYMALVPGMLVLGSGIGLFYSSVTTAGITALDPSRASLAGAIVYMFQIAGGSIGLGLNTAIIVTAPNFTEGIARAFILDAGLAVIGLMICLWLVGGPFSFKNLFSGIMANKNERE